MTLDALIVLSGVLVAVLPFLGFPNTWDAVLMLGMGVLIIALGISVRRRGHIHDQRTQAETYTEHIPHESR